MSKVKVNLSKFRAALLLLALCFMFVLCGTAFAAIAEEYVEGEAMVLLRYNGTSKLTAADAAGAAVQSYVSGVAAKADAESVRTYNALTVATGKIFAHFKSDTLNTKELIAKLESDPNVISASPNHIARALATPNDPDYSSLWGMARINAPRAWDVTTGSGTTYAVVADTGIRATHEDLAANFDASHSAGFNNSGSPSTYNDGQGHGTHVSGTVGAVGNNGKGVVGVNWNTKIIAVKVLDDSGFGTDASIEAGLDYIQDLLDNNPNMRIPAMNYSIGGWWNVNPDDVKSDAQYEAFKALSDTDRIVMAVAAGNEGLEVGAPAPPGNSAGKTPGYYCYPASFRDIDNMIVVGATDSSDAAASFTNWSKDYVDILAPGVGIWSTGCTADSYYYNNSGTSMAAPHVAGSVALLASEYPDWKANGLKRAILEAVNGSVNPVTGPIDKPSDGNPVSKNGLLDIGKALDVVKEIEEDDPELSKIVPSSEGTLEPPFKPDVFQYTLKVDSSVKSISLTFTVPYPTLTTIKMDGKKVESGVPESIDVSADKEIIVEVEFDSSVSASAAAGTKKQYKINVQVDNDPSDDGTGGCDTGAGIFLALVLLAGSTALMRKKRINAGSAK